MESIARQLADTRTTRRVAGARMDRLDSDWGGTAAFRRAAKRDHARAIRRGARAVIAAQIAEVA